MYAPSPPRRRADFYGRVDAAWAAGLWRFFSDSPPNATAADVLEQATQVAAGSGVNAQPPAFVLEPSAPSQAVQVYWGDPIPQGTSVTVNVSYEVVPRNSPGARGAAAATAADFEVAPAALTFTKQGGRDVTEGELQFVNAQTLTVSLGAPRSRWLAARAKEAAGTPCPCACA